MIVVCIDETDNREIRSSAIKRVDHVWAEAACFRRTRCVLKERRRRLAKTPLPLTPLSTPAPAPARASPQILSSIMLRRLEARLQLRRHLVRAQVLQGLSANRTSVTRQKLVLGKFISTLCRFRESFYFLLAIFFILGEVSGTAESDCLHRRRSRRKQSIENAGLNRYIGFKPKNLSWVL